MSKPTELIPALTGLIGTLGGIIISYLSLKHTLGSDKFDVEIRISKKILATPQPGTTKAKLSEEQLTFFVANKGKKDFRAALLGIRVGKRSDAFAIPMPLGTVPLPHTLKPDDTVNFWTEYDNFVKKIKKPKLYSRVKIRGEISDYLGNTFVSKPIKVEFKEPWWLKAARIVRKFCRDILRYIQP